VQADAVSDFKAEAAPNQAPPLQGVNLYTRDRALQEAVARHGAAWAQPALLRLGELAGATRMIELGHLANRYPPVLHTHDRYGNRRDTVEFHPAYHELMSLACAAGLHTSPWADPRQGAHVARAAGYMLYGQIENGTQCPLTMTFAAAPLLAHHADSLPALGETWLPRLHARRYDERFTPIEDKDGATIGMGMTETGWLRCAQQPVARDARGAPRTGAAVPDPRPQVVPVGADVRRLLGARTG
jgi:putative acyl-CoA dehydrogenase